MESKKLIKEIKLALSLSKKDVSTEEYLARLKFAQMALGWIIEDIENPQPERIDFGKLERKVSPPLEAYKYTGVNKLDIENSKRGYGTTFE